MSTPVQPNAGDPFAKGGTGTGNPYSAGPPAGSGQGGYGGPPSYPGQGSPAQGNAAPGYPQQGYPGQGYPAQGQQGGGYPTQASYQGAPGYPGSYPGGAGLTPEPVRPNTVNWAFWCWILTTVASLISLIVTLTSSVWGDAVRAGINTSSQTVNGQQINIDAQTLVNTIKIVAVVFFVIFAAVYLLFAFKMRAGRNWARIVLTVFGALTLLSAVSRTANTVTVGTQTYSTNPGPGFVTAVLALAGIVLMYVGQSNKYFTDSKAFRQSVR